MAEFQSQTIKITCTGKSTKTGLWALLWVEIQIVRKGAIESEIGFPMYVEEDKLMELSESQ